MPTLTATELKRYSENSTTKKLINTIVQSKLAVRHTCISLSPAGLKKIQAEEIVYRKFITTKDTILEYPLAVENKQAEDFIVISNRTLSR